MGELTPSRLAETGVLKEAYAALNRNDIPAMLNAFDPQIEWIEPWEHPGGTTRRGRDEVEAHLSQARSSWAEGGCDPERFVVAGDKIVVFIHVHVRLKGHTDWADGRLAAVYTFRSGKAVEQRTFDDTEQALLWAGVGDPDTN